MLTIQDKEYDLERFTILTNKIAMMRIIYLIIALIVLPTSMTAAVEMSISARAGYSPAVGGSMSSQWQADNMGSPDGINTINRSQAGTELSTVEVPRGVVGGVGVRFTGDVIYFRWGVEGVYTMFGGKGKTLNPAGTEVVNVNYSQWSVDVPFTIGMSLLFWGESRVYAGVGMALAYGSFSSSFKSASLDHSAGFKGYAVPLVAEAGCEYMLTQKLSVGCEIKYFSGKSDPVKSGSDSARVDFSGYHITAGVSWRFNI